MDKEIKTTSQETLDTETNKNIDYISIETVPEPDYSYGNGNQTLDYNVAMRNKPNIYNPLLFVWT